MAGTMNRLRTGGHECFIYAPKIGDPSPKSEEEMVHSGNHAFLVCNASSLHRKLQHVRARRCVPGEESLAQVYREIEAPKHKNLIRAGLVIFVFSLTFTSLVSFFAVMIIPDAERSKYFDNLQ